MSNIEDLKVHLAYDEDAAVWYVAESDIPGLRLEADEPLELVRRIAESAAELVALNGSENSGKVGFTPIFDSAVPIAA